MLLPDLPDLKRIGWERRHIRRIPSFGNVQGRDVFTVMAEYYADLSEVHVLLQRDTVQQRPDLFRRLIVMRDQNLQFHIRPFLMRS